MSVPSTIDGLRRGGFRAFSLIFILLVTCPALKSMCFEAHRIRRLEAYAFQSSQDPRLEDARARLREQLATWAEARVRYAVGYAEKSWTFSELQLIDATGQRTLLFLVWERDGTWHWDMVVGEQGAKGWHFFLAGLPGFTLQGHERAEALASVQKQLVRDGLVSWRGKISQRYLRERWFDADRSEKQAAWLGDKVEN